MGQLTNYSVLQKLIWQQICVGVKSEWLEFSGSNRLVWVHNSSQCRFEKMTKKIATPRRTTTLKGNNASFVSGPKRHACENKWKESKMWSSR